MPSPSDSALLGEAVGLLREAASGLRTSEDPSEATWTDYLRRVTMAEAAAARAVEGPAPAPVFFDHDADGNAVDARAAVEGPADVGLGKYGHHPDPETDAALEAEVLEGRLCEAWTAAGIIPVIGACDLADRSLKLPAHIMAALASTPAKEG